jgi:hypothetical protein
MDDVYGISFLTNLHLNKEFVNPVPYAKILTHSAVPSPAFQGEGKDAPLRVNPEQVPAFRLESRRVDFLGSRYSDSCHCLEDRSFLYPVRKPRCLQRGRR